MTRDVEKTCITNATTEPVEHDEIEITPEMIEAGEREFDFFDPRVDDYGAQAIAIYEAMFRVSPTNATTDTRQHEAIEITEGMLEDALRRISSIVDGCTDTAYNADGIAEEIIDALFEVWPIARALPL